MSARNLGVAGLVGLLFGGSVLAQDGPVTKKELQPVLDQAVKYLKSSQLEDGSFAPKVAGPGVTALVTAALLRNGVSAQEPVVAKALQYLEKNVQKDGGIYSKFLANYTTSVAIMAFEEANSQGKYDTVLKNASKFLKEIQIDAENQPTHGGFGYNGKTRPDLSNTGFSVQALLQAGVPKDDPAIQKALKFISRCQNLPGETNDMEFAQKASAEDKGGFVYDPTAKADSPHRTAAGGLRSVGSMTYTGLKSFLYAGVSKDDPRVKAAINWVRQHYTLNENPGLGQSGLYYYYHTFGKAMEAYGENPFVDASGTKHNWQRELFQALKSRQQADGSWKNMGDRTFAEDNPDLATAFALLSLAYIQEKK